MSKMLLACLPFLAVSQVALACMCPPDMAAWLRRADTVLVVRVDSVTWGGEDPVSGNTCDTARPSCFGAQMATVKAVHAIKGDGRSLTTVSSGYGGGDCGIPLIAGAYYVVFLRGGGRSVGSCNAVGPYIRLSGDSGPYPREISHYVRSVEAAMKDPKAAIAPAPAPRRLEGSSFK